MFLRTISMTLICMTLLSALQSQPIPPAPPPITLTPTVSVKATPTPVLVTKPAPPQKSGGKYVLYLPWVETGR